VAEELWGTMHRCDEARINCSMTVY